MGLPAIAKNALFSLLPKISELTAQVNVNANLAVRTSPHSPDPSTSTNEAAIENMSNSIAELEQRLEKVEGNSVLHTELITHLVGQNATLARWVLALAIVSAISSGIAIAALVLAIL